MNDLLRTILGVIAVIVLALAISGTKDGAKLVQMAVVFAIIVVLLKNTNAVQDSARNLTSLVVGAERKPTGTGGN